MAPPLPGHQNQAVLVVSERLTNFESEWRSPRNICFWSIIDMKLNVRLFD